jgi:CheY-like chemotaxis protein
MAQPMIQQSPDQEPGTPLKGSLHLPLVLIVEDDAGVRDCLQMLLQDELPNLRTCTVATFREAERAATVLHPDLLICDIRLPDGDGRTLLARLRRRRGLANIPAILLTVLDVDDPALREDAAALRAHLIAKPFEITTLLDEVLDALIT